MEEKGYTLTENPDGTFTLTLNIAGDSCSVTEADWRTFEKVSVISLSAAAERVPDIRSRVFPNLKEIRVHPENQHFTVEDGVLFSKDKKTIIGYFRQGVGDAYRIGDGVEEIARGCFAGCPGLARIDIGRNVRKIGHCGLCNDGGDFLEKIYIPPTVTELNGEIFDRGADDGGIYYPVCMVGGARDSAIEEYCNQRAIDFVAVTEDEIEDFYTASVEELRQRIREQAEEEKTFFADEPPKGYQAKFSKGVLTFSVSDGGSGAQIVIKDTHMIINASRRRKVEKLIIGPGITEIAEYAFDDYPNLQRVHIGPDVCSISPVAFSDTYGNGSKLASIAVAETNKWYKAMDGVLYTHDMQTLVKYSPARPELYHQVDARVRHIGEFAFAYANALQCLLVGPGCVSVGDAAFLNVRDLRHAYFADSVTEWPEDYPFIGSYGFDRPFNLPVVMGGKRGSFAEKYCAQKGVHFLAIEDGQLQNFLKTPLPGQDEDPYRAECLKVMLVDQNGELRQLGETGEELVLPEGVVRMHERMNLSGCKRVVIPSTAQHLWTQGFFGPAKELKEFVVDESNPSYRSAGGHLYTHQGTLLSYAPAAEYPGILPEETVAIDEKAFCLLPAPFEKVYIPSSVQSLPPCWDEWFYEAEVSRDNPRFRSVDGSIFSADGKELVCAKLSRWGYRIPDGTERICESALCQVHGQVFIPGSVTDIEDVWDLGLHITGICTPAGSYAETYAGEHSIPAELV